MIGIKMLNVNINPLNQYKPHFVDNTIFIPLQRKLLSKITQEKKSLKTFKLEINDYSYLWFTQDFLFIFCQ